MCNVIYLLFFLHIMANFDEIILFDAIIMPRYRQAKEFIRFCIIKRYL